MYRVNQKFYPLRFSDTKTRFSRMHRAATAESILVKFGTSTPWADVVIYLKRHPNWSKGLGR